MSSDAIIAGLKQGNAIEMASLEEVKEGMSSVIDGLLKECYNRSDALSDLMEKVQLESSSAAAKTMTAEQKFRLTKAIRDAIGDCEKAIRVNDDKRASERVQAWTYRQAETDVLDTVRDHALARENIMGHRMKISEDKGEDADHAALRKLNEEEHELSRKLLSSYKSARKDLKDRQDLRSKEIENTHKTSQNALEKQIESLKRIATIAKIDLKATSRDEASDDVSFQEAQAAHLSLASSPVGRGGGGSFQSRPTDPFPSIPDSQTLTVDYLRSLGR
ncbi:uncharacterized protein J4E87_004693 [Alternaria ethzedia]|uniref:uncharacterized protein n=1 Tax=Alternaria ethzedia TaxID=181014 RepID=UPI0020C34373|nr:uncharacterized protein J4E87_004693 [Alternaria ethzedia]KAI4626193.1 hypothetical protein J4E87_004693 [Alternaria ethzedia]